VVAVVLASLTLTASPAAAADSDTYIARINGLRTSNGLAPLTVDGNLTALAQDWANHMADIGTLAHTPDLTAGLTHTGWTKLGENVGAGTSVDQVFSAFLGSSAHYGNLTNPAFTHVGVGVAYAGGKHFTVHRFMALGGGGSAPPADSPPPVRRQEPVVVTPTTTPPGPEPEAPAEEAEPVVPAVPEGPRPEAGRVGAVLVALRAANR
jgi:hypothetical protein